jgi:hypothetical protein
MIALFTVTRDEQGAIILSTSDHDMVADVAEGVVKRIPLSMLTMIDQGIKRPQRPHYRDAARDMIPDFSLILARLTTDEARNLALALLKQTDHPTVLVPLLRLVMSE